MDTMFLGGSQHVSPLRISDAEDTASPEFFGISSVPHGERGAIVSMGHPEVRNKDAASALVLTAVKGGLRLGDRRDSAPTIEKIHQL